MKYTFQEAAVAFLLLMLFLWIALTTRKTTKQSIADFYKITRPTMAKWIKYFYSGDLRESWKGKKYLTSSEVEIVKSYLGYEVDFVMSKKQIAARAESDYRTVSANVKRNLDKIGISWEAWESCNCFPPSVSKRILDMLG